ncbi:MULTISPECIES: hypothetical protein [unclassified Burkholderia]|uniref:hypothetical protein n=1 Tax=unclassified Burkholderia TaxID=2613784 RepID=UPI00187D244B|nr:MULTISPECIES: hypothetical protein [unclassified Burkholderia]
MSSQIRTVLPVTDGSRAHAVNSNSGASNRRTISRFFPHVLFAPYCFARSRPRERVPGLRAARRIQFTHADTQSKALSGSLWLSSNRSVTRWLPLFAGPNVSTPASKHDATNNSDVVSNNNGEKWHVKVIRIFKVCVLRHF